MNTIAARSYTEPFKTTSEIRQNLRERERERERESERERMSLLIYYIFRQIL